jgi:hypothetical protein
MSYTESNYTASCQVADDFNLQEYLTSLVDFVGNHVDDLPKSIQWLGDYSHKELLETFETYVRESGGKILIELDSEESNYDSELWDWLCDQIREDAMTSKFMVMNYSTNDSRCGVECGTSYYLKDGTFIGSDDIQSIVEQHFNLTT